MSASKNIACPDLRGGRKITGFTLIERLVVITIIAILAAVLLWALSAAMAGLWPIAPSTHRQSECPFR